MVKAKIEKIYLTEKQQKKIEKSPTPLSKWNNERMVRRFCTKCNNFATKKVIIQIEGAQLIERYCDEHYRG